MKAVTLVKPGVFVAVFNVRAAGDNDTQLIGASV